MINKLSAAELAKFLVVGSTTVCIDLAAYLVLSNYLYLSLSKGISFVIGCIFAFFANKYITFEHRGNLLSNFVKFGFLYSMTLFLNVFLNSFMLYLFPHSKMLAFTIATGASAAVNFLGMKVWIFKRALSI